MCEEIIHSVLILSIAIYMKIISSVWSQ